MNKMIKRQESPSWSSSWRPLTLMALEANKDETGWPGTPADAPRPPKLKKPETEISKIQNNRSHFFVKTFKGENLKIQNKPGKFTWQISELQNIRPHFFGKSFKGENLKFKIKAGNFTCAAMHLNLGLRYHERCKNSLSG
jgi:hypothetical protein